MASNSPNDICCNSYLLLQICVWPSTPPSPLLPSRWPRREKISHLLVLFPSDVATQRYLWLNGPFYQRAQINQKTNSSSLVSIWGRSVSMATTQKVSHGQRWSWKWWNRGRSLSWLSWTCLRGTGGSTCAGCRSLKSIRLAGKLRPTTLLLLSSEVRAWFAILELPYRYSYCLRFDDL